MARTNYLKEILHNPKSLKKNSKKVKLISLCTELEDVFLTFKYKNQELPENLIACIFMNATIKLNTLLHLVPDDLYRNQPSSIRLPEILREKLSLLIYKDKNLEYKIHKIYLSQLSKLIEDLANLITKHM